jgi:hypothetical protein
MRGAALPALLYLGGAMLAGVALASAGVAIAGSALAGRRVWRRWRSESDEELVDGGWEESVEEAGSPSAETPPAAPIEAEARV